MPDSEMPDTEWARSSSPEPARSSAEDKEWILMREVMINDVKMMIIMAMIKNNDHN